MPIFLEQNETKSNNKTTQYLTNFIPVPGLEEVTGADMLLSVLGIPPINESILKMHLGKKACLIQIKHDLDIESYDQMKLEQARMLQVARIPAQRMLLFVKSLDFGNPWLAEDARQAWIERGGVVSEVLADNLDIWVQMKLKRIQKCIDEPEREFLPSPANFKDLANEDVLQTLKVIDDQRVTLATLPGVGSILANRIYQKAQENNFFTDLVSLIKLVTDEPPRVKIEGLGDGKRAKIREYVGLCKGLNLGLWSLEENRKNDTIFVMGR